MIVHASRHCVFCCAIALATATPVCVAREAAGSGYELHADVVAAGGTPMQGANGWRLDGTIGQVDAKVRHDGAQIILDGGFWPTAATAMTNDRIFANGFDTSVTADSEHRH